MKSGDASNVIQAVRETAPFRDDLTLALPWEGPGHQVLELSFLTALPNLRRPLFEAFKRWSIDKRRSTRVTQLQFLRTGFCAFLLERGASHIALDSISNITLNEFVDWVNRSPSQRGKKKSPAYRKCLVSALKVIFRALLTSEEYGAEAERILSIFPAKRFPGAHKRQIPRKRISRVEFADAIRAAELEVIAIESMLNAGDDLITRGLHKLQSTCISGDCPVDKEIALALLSKWSGEITHENVRGASPRLYNALPKLGQLKALTRHLYPSPRDLVPFIILIAAASAYNPDTLLSLRWRDVTKDDVFGVELVRLTGHKGRSSRQPLPLAAGPTRGMGIGKLFDILERWTARIRPRVDPAHRDNVFIFVPLTKSAKAKAFGTDKYGPSSDESWMHNLKLFCEQNSLPRFSLSQLRVTVLDEIQFRTGDLLMAKALGRHANPVTTWKHYTSDGTKQRYNELLGSVFLLKDRWVTSQGVIDPRERTERQDHGAATPGFLCLDPFDSPEANQERGRLCNAYGRCPSCPLAAANIADPTTVASYLGLHAAIAKSQESLGPQVFARQWAPVLADLECLIARILPEVKEAAASFAVRLPVVG